jgi:hydroxyacylglutathione hydrolase
MKQIILWTCALIAILAALVLYFAPYTIPEIPGLGASYDIVDPANPDLAAGQMADDYWAVQPIDAKTIAIGEPRYYQQNYAYLITGERRALLFDAGSGTRGNITLIVAGLTQLPVTVMPSHLHFDHTGGIKPFQSIAMIDLPETRADVTNGQFTIGRYEFHGMRDGLTPPTFTVTEWLKPDSKIDLGGRVLTVLSVPGHTPTSVALYDPASHQLFSGDYIYPTTLYAFLPGSSLSAYRATTKRLLAMLPADTRIWTAHCCRANEKISAPWLTMKDLKDLDSALAEIDEGRAHGTGFFPRRFPVNDQMTIFTGFPWNNR